jgi:PKD repeat protein
MKKSILVLAFLLAINCVKAQVSSCQSDFVYVSTGLSVYFVDSSSGNTMPTNWNWNFGDGVLSSDQNPMHTYSQSGMYVVCLTVYQPFTNCQSTYCDSVTVVENSNSCVASFIYNKDTSDGTLINFYDSSLPDSTHYLWDFGDGTTDSIKNPVHNYTYAGTYTVCLTIADTAGCTDTYCQNLLAGNQGCSAHFTHANDSINAHLLHFTDDSQGTPSHWVWTFGNNDSAFTQMPDHLFGATGYYNVCLTIYDSSLNCTDTYCEYVQISNCYASYSAVSDSLNPRKVYFTDNSFGTPTGWHWDFEDGTTSDVQNPIHTYPFDAWHQVCLTVTDSIQGCTSTFCKLIYGGSPSSCYEYWDLHADSTDAKTIYFVESSWGTTPTNFLWHFGDGDSSTVRNPVHTYTSEGIYFVCCTISDSAGTCSYSDCYNLNVGENNICHAHFNYSAVSGSIISFVDSSYGVAATNHLWDFGSNWGTSGQLNPYNNFQTPGTYYVCLTITDSNSTCNSTYCDSVVVPENTGVGNYLLEDNVIIYPNPTKDNLYIQNLSHNAGTGTWRIKIYNPIGELIEERAANADVEVVDFANRAAGLYLVTLQNNKSLIQKRVMIAR